MGILNGKRALVLGVANDHSIAWAIAQALQREGAELALTYVGPSIERRVRPLADSIGCSLVLPCDVTVDDDIRGLAERLGSEWSRVDVVVHAVAYALREDLKGRFVDTSREGFHTALDVSVYSLVAVARAMEPLMPSGSSIVTLTYLGAEKVLPNYNVMGVAKAALESSVRYLAADLGGRGIRDNAISAGPVRTLSAAGITGFKDMMRRHAERAPLQRSITAAEVGGTAVFLASELASAITGEVIHADAGYSIIGV
jgi:enoyl-[acyl-carrier protein] reductase I